MHMQTFWVVPTKNVFRADFTQPGKNATSTVIDLNAPTVAEMDGPPQSLDLAALPGVEAQVVRPELAPSAFEVDPANAELIAQATEGAIGAYMFNGTFPRNQYVQFIILCGNMWCGH